MINIGDKIEVINFQEQSINADIAVALTKQGFATVLYIDIFDEKIYVTIKEYPDLIIWKFRKK